MLGYVGQQRICQLNPSQEGIHPASELADKMGQSTWRCCDTTSLQIHPLEDAALELGHN